MATARTCAPSDVLGNNPCLKCLSETELMMLLFLLWADAAGYTLPDDLTTINGLAACNTCTSAKQKLEMEIVAMGLIYEASTTVDEMVAKVKCLPCMQKEQILAGIAYAKCVYWAAQSPQ